MENKRSGGVLMPIFALPGEYGVGSFGRGAMRFVQRLRESGFRYWQVLPFCLADEYHSPYKSYSSFSIDPWFADIGILSEKGLITEQERRGALQRVDHTCEYGRREERMALLAKAAERAGARAEIRAAVDETMARFPYLAEFCAYMAAREGGDRLFFWQFIESEALSQWMALKSYANSLGIEIIGDLPIYVSEESSEVAYHKEWFLLDGEGRPSAVAGVPPDYFCPDGQLWGNPLYNYARMAEDGYAFWRERMSYMLTLFDGVRMDHFRALCAFWAVPAGAASAKEGGWIEAPGREILDALRPITEGRLVIAEDLGNITEDVVELVKYSGFPGMRVLQFGFLSESDRVHLPHYYGENTVAYTGTHDNNTLLGFMFHLPAHLRERVLAYIGREGEDFNTRPVYEGILRFLLCSPARTVMLPMQDILLFGEDTRYNTPGRPEGNWAFRFSEQQIESAPWERMRMLLSLYGRC
ncbi:MAG: 4-alpha-glucanotransferase [Clostridia bacterium]|nr:4-alpha-glucanotransferase [Clostridia bacterium]